MQPIRASAAVLGLVALILCTPAAAAAQAWPEVVGALDRSVLPVHMGTGDVPASCSAVVIHADAGYVVTAAHCVPTAEHASIIVAGRHAEVARVNRVLDLAVLRTKLNGAASIALAPAMPGAGHPVAIIGYPFGAQSITTQLGSVANAKGRDGYAWVDGAVLPGDSGGAVVDNRGRLVGVSSGYLAAGAAHIGLIVPLETVRDFVEDLLPEPAP